MFKQYFQQAWGQLRQQPLISLVNILGTALSIFLIMLVVMMQQVKVAPFAPESNRDRFLHVRCGSITNEEWGEGNSSNGPISVRTGARAVQVADHARGRHPLHHRHHGHARQPAQPARHGGGREGDGR